MLFALRKGIPERFSFIWQVVCNDGKPLYPAEVAAEETTCPKDAGRAKRARKPPVL